MRYRDGKFVRTDIWREGEYLDLWSVPHFLSGVLLALIMHFVGFDVVPTFVIALLLLIAYEMFEVIAQIEETRWNRILDVIVGCVSFVPTFLLVSLASTEVAVLALIVVGIVDGALSFLGWSASRKASVLETKLRGEFAIQKKRLIEGRRTWQMKLRERRLAWRERRIFRHRRLLSAAIKRDITNGAHKIY